MKNPIIYFSKSRNGNLDDILFTRNYLSKYKCEVTQFEGGHYSPDKLETSDLLIILPPDLSYPDMIGRGQYEEFLNSLEDSHKLNLPFIITRIYDNILYGNLISKVYLINNNWTTDYGRFLDIRTPSFKEEELSIVLNLQKINTISIEKKNIIPIQENNIKKYDVFDSITL